jgi:hypothetical protein
MRILKTLLTVLLIGFSARLGGADGGANPVQPARAAGQTVETIVCLRHGESTRTELGQLTCRGLNRALALPAVLLAKYGSPQFVFACNPAEKIDGYNYVRPLATIEPTAIRCGLPVNTDFGASEITGLQEALQGPEFRNATIFVAWEHKALDEFVRNLLQANGGNPREVPSWPGDDFDTIIVVRIARAGDQKSITLAIDHEGLDHLSDKCPQVRQ